MAGHRHRPAGGDLSRRIAYWVFPEHPASAAHTASVRIPAEQVLHVLKPLAPGQLRGASWLAPIILPFRATKVRATGTTGTYVAVF